MGLKSIVTEKAKQLLGKISFRGIERPAADIGKIKKCYIYFMADNVLGKVVRPWCKFLPDGKIAVYWRPKNVKGGWKKWVTPLPKQVLMDPRTSSLKIRSGNVIVVYSHDIYGNPVEIPNPILLKFRQLLSLNKALIEILKEKEVELKMLGSPTEERLARITSQIEDIVRSTKAVGEELKLYETELRKEESESL